MRLDGPFGLVHIIYLIISIIVIVLEILFAKKLFKTKKAYDLTFKITGVVLLVLLIITKIYDLYITTTLNPGYYEFTEWYHFIPSTYCQMAGFILAVALIVAKRSNSIFHFISYITFIGCLGTCFYPVYIEGVGFDYMSSWTAVVYHIMFGLIFILMLIEGEFKPTIRKWYLYPVGMLGFTVLGLFEIQVMNYKNAMNIYEGLVPSIDKLTRWYVLIAASTLALIIFLFIYEGVHNKKPFKRICFEMVHPNYENYVNPTKKNEKKCEDENKTSSIKK